jgi:hypothetical protein
LHRNKTAKEAGGSTLRETVVINPSKKQKPVVVAVGPGDDSFPMDEDFKEF